MRSKGTAAELEARRRLAVQRVSEGWKRRDVAAFLGVHPETVAEWVRAHAGGGDAALAAKPHPGRKPFLTPDQEKRVLGWLADPPTKHGFRTDLWTARRVTELIRKRLGVEYHPHYLREWLTKRGYSPQKPARRPRQRDQAAIDRWLRDDWPRIKKSAGGGRPTSS
ncbi:MAG: winged helix-turn-helix domain-containing protein [Actinobacteria bacterium]|nr:winged helix-turn-helix domain-containing protein [Actinomycetota bacterium]